MTRLPLSILCFALVPLLLSACATRSAKTTVYDDNRVKVLLRSQVKGGDPADRGFQHPVQISEERLRSILRQIEFRTKDDGPEQKRQVFAPALVSNIATGLSQALAEADSSQEVAVMAVHKHFSLGVFTRKTLTSFVSYVEGDELFILFSRIDWTVDAKAQKGGSQEKIPEPHANDKVMKFRLLASAPLEKAGSRGVRTAWRDAHWGPSVAAAPVATRRSTVVREREAVAVEKEVAKELETIAKEEQAELPKAVDLEPLPYPSSPDGLRALADLEEARQAGTISDAEYRRRRRALAE